MRSFRPFKPYRDRPLCFVDVEGTGTDFRHHEVTEVGLLHTKKGSACVQVKPRNLGNAQEGALRVSRFNHRDWADAPDFSEHAPMLAEWFEDATIVGHNVSGYDIPMLSEEFRRRNLEHDHLFRDVIDTMQLARFILVPLGLKRLGLGSCMKFIGEEYEDAHSAFTDTVYCKKLYDYIEKNIKWHGSVSGKKIQESLF